jgi:hypothetical protein
LELLEIIWKFFVATVLVCNINDEYGVKRACRYGVRLEFFLNGLELNFALDFAASGCYQALICFSLICLKNDSQFIGVVVDYTTGDSNRFTLVDYLIDVVEDLSFVMVAVHIFMSSGMFSFFYSGLEVA